MPAEFPARLNRHGSGDWLWLPFYSNPEVRRSQGRFDGRFAIGINGGGVGWAGGGKLGRGIVFDWAVARLPQSDRRPANHGHRLGMLADEALSQEKTSRFDIDSRDCLDQSRGRWVG